MPRPKQERHYLNQASPAFPLNEAIRLAHIGSVKYPASTDGGESELTLVDYQDICESIRLNLEKHRSRVELKLKELLAATG